MSSSPATPSKAEKPTETSLGTPKSSIVPSSPPPASPKPAASSESTASSSDRPKAKPTNVFSDDGSFLERFQRLKKEESEKQAAENVAEKKRTFEDRFKNRGKRPAPTTEAEGSGEGSGASAKKAKTGKVLSQYEKEVQGYESRSLKDQGIGVRPLVK